MRVTLTIFVLVGLCGPSFADTERQYGLGSRAAALGGAFSAVADDFSASYYNPAGLALRPPTNTKLTGIDLHFGMTWTRPSVWLKRGQAEGGEVTFGAKAAHAGLTASPVDHRIESAGAYVAGLRLDLEQLVELPRTVFGLAVVFPAKRFFRWDVQPNTSLQWPMMQDRTERLSVFPALAIKLHPRVSIGMGCHISVTVKTNTEAVVLAGETSDGNPVTELGNEVSIAGRLAPTAGILAKPTDWLNIALTWRGKLEADDFGYTDVDISQLPGSGLNTFGYTHRFAHYFTPMELTLGIAANITSDLMLTTDVTWSRWSEYLDSNHDNYGGDISNDTVTPRVGVQWQFHNTTAALFGYSYLQSPFDNQGSWTNFVDNDRQIFSLGTQTDLVRLPGGGPPLRINWHAQIHTLRNHREVKDWRKFISQDEAESNPGWPGWMSGGWVLNLGLSVEASF